jgi:signal transduction histidine kinase/ActR/RegA family two-component response regulator
MIHRRRRTTATWPVILFLLVLALAGLLVFSIERYERLQDRMAIKVPINRVWNSSQLEVELARFLNTLLRYGGGEAGVASDRLLEHFEVLWSRIGRYQEGALARAIADDPASRLPVTGLLALLPSVEPTLAALRFGDLAGARALHARFAPFTSQVRQMTSADLHRDLQQQEELRAVHQEMNRHMLVFVALFLAAAALVVMGALRSARQLHRLLDAAETARHDAERSRIQLRQAIASISEGFALYDPQDRLVLCNDRYRAFDPAGAEPPRPGDRLDRTGQTGEPGHARAGVAEEHLADGRWVLVSDRVTEDGGRVCIQTDVSELKRRELELTEAKTRLERQAGEMRELAEAAEQGSKAKSQFLATMSHEIRTPLTAILGFSDLLARSPLSPEQHEQLRIVRDTGQTLLTVVNDILDLSKLEAGKMSLEQVPLELPALLREALATTQLLGAEKGLTFRAELAPDLPAWVEGDPVRLKQVAGNLLFNALKFTERGSITLRATVAGHEPGAGWVRVEVEDTGIGITAEQLPRLFGLFEQADQSTTRCFGGSGLGLAICQRLVGAMDGRIGVESVPGRGSTFWVELPLRLAAALPAPVAEVTAAPARALRVLAVDDVATNRLLLTALLRERGHQAVTAEDGVKAVEAAGRERFDLILMDLHMPGLDGFMAARALRAGGGPNAATPIVALSADVLPATVAACRAAGMAGHLAKPIERAKLQELLGGLAPVPSAGVVRDRNASSGLDRQPSGRVV